jgi:hypothetical protein
MVRDSNSTSATNGRDKGSGSSRGPSKGGAYIGGSAKPSAIETQFGLMTDGKLQATFTSVLDRITGHVQRTYEEGSRVAETLNDMAITAIDRPRIRAVSADGDAATQAMELIENQIEYTADMELYKQGERMFSFNLKKVYALIYDVYCATTMQNRLDEMIDADPRISNDPLLLLGAIRILMQEPVKEQDPTWSLIKSLLTGLSIKQQSNESMSDFTKRFKQNCEFIKQQVGPRFADAWTIRQPEYMALEDDDQLDTRQEALKAATFPRICASLMIHSADPYRYGSLVAGLNTQFNLGNDQWPKTIKVAAKFLSSHQLDNKREIPSHKATSFAQRAARDVSNLVCNCCGIKGHISPDCSKRTTIPPEKWFKPKVKKVFAQSADTDGEETENENTESEVDQSTDDERASRRRSATPKRSKASRPRGKKKSTRDSVVDDGWAAFTLWHEGPDDVYHQVQLKQQSQEASKWSSLLHDKIVLDTGSTISGTIMNPDFVTNIMSASKPITMSTNAGSKRLTMCGEVPGFGPVYYDDTQMANIFGFSFLADKHRITYDSRKEDAFLVHLGTRVIKFRRTTEGLYVYKPDQKFLDNVARQKNLTPPVYEDATHDPSSESESDEESHHLEFSQHACPSSDEDSVEEDAFDEAEGEDSSDDDDVPALALRQCVSSDSDSDDDDDVPPLARRTYYPSDDESEDEEEDDEPPPMDDDDSADDDVPPLVRDSDTIQRPPHSAPDTSFAED